MIERTVKTLTGQLSIKIPSALTELKLGQLMQMQAIEKLSDLDAISILSGTPVADLKNVVHFNEFDVFGDAILSLSGQIKYLYNAEAIPDKITFDIDSKKVSVKVNRNLSIEPAGAFMASRDIIAEEISNHIKQHGDEDWQATFNPSLKACCQVLAQYFYCRATGSRYDEYKAEEFAETIKTLGVTEALPIARYFFMSFLGLSRPKTGFLQRLRQLWRKKQEYRLSKNLNISIP